jgi:CheY-like chemotaxis protein
LQITRELREAMRDGASEDEIADAARKDGYIDLWSAGLVLAADGVTSLNEISRVIGREIPSSSVVQQAKHVPIPPKAPDPVAEKVQSAVESAKHADVEARVSILELAESMREEDERVVEERRILLIDDDLHVRKIMHRELKKENFEVIEAVDGHDGIAKAMEHLPDLIVCDLMMPGCDGRQVVTTLRKNDRTHKIPVVMLTSMSDEVYELELIKAGADDFITKSSSPKVVAARIKRFFRG